MRLRKATTSKHHYQIKKTVVNKRHNINEWRRFCCEKAFVAYLLDCGLHESVFFAFLFNICQGWVAKKSHLVLLILLHCDKGLPREEALYHRVVDRAQYRRARTSHCGRRRATAAASNIRSPQQPRKPPADSVPVGIRPSAEKTPEVRAAETSQLSDSIVSLHPTLLGGARSQAGWKA